MNVRQVQVNMNMRKFDGPNPSMADRCFNQFNSSGSKYGYTQNLFPIVQGGTFKDLRKTSCEYITAKNAAGNAIGGLSVGEPEEMMYEITAIGVAKICL